MEFEKWLAIKIVFIFALGSLVAGFNAPDEAMAYIVFGNFLVLGPLLALLIIRGFNLSLFGDSNEATYITVIGVGALSPFVGPLLKGAEPGNFTLAIGLAVVTGLLLLLLVWRIYRAGPYEADASIVLAA